MTDIMDVLADIFDLEKEEFNENTVLADLDEWDSLAKLFLMTEAKKSYNKKITTEDMNGFLTIKDIIDYLSN